MSKKSEGEARMCALRAIADMLIDKDPRVASAGRLLAIITPWHAEWIAEEQKRKTEAADALTACIEAYVRLIHSVMQMACSPANLDKAEALVLRKITAAWKRTANDLRQGVD